MGVSNLTIRSIEPDDYRAMQTLFALPGVIRGTMQIPFPSVELWRKRVTELPDSWRLLVACVEDRLVGNITLSIPQNPRRRHVGEIGIVVHDDWCGRGIGTALLQSAIDLADRWLNLSRLELSVYVDNAPAIALYEKCGFKREGRYEHHAFRDGEYVDTLAMARVLNSIAAAGSGPHRAIGVRPEFL
jgi:L-phenylalanine/L-methionine N-acetyltransferase